MKQNTGDGVGQTDPRTFVTHGYPENTVDLGEITMNYAEAGDRSNPALLLIPGQSESWWGYEGLMKLLESQFHVFAVDLRGQGRSSWTPGRYTFDNLGNDLVRFISLVIRRPLVVSGNSSGGILSAWLAAYALPGQIRGALLEDPPFFSAEPSPLYGQSMRQSAAPILELFVQHIGDQWKKGDWEGFKTAAKVSVSPLARMMGGFDQVPQNFKEYDPEWSRAFLEGTMSAACAHERLLAHVKVPILLTHHARSVDPETGNLVGALSDLQARKVSELISKTDATFECQSFPEAAHSMHAFDPAKFAAVLTAWASKLSSEQR
jgi:pimeloyl-ACP methyl ester carboxylesterase